MDQIWMDRLIFLGHNLYKNFGDHICLAGGAVRNARTDRAIKDLDIFFDDENLVPAICSMLRLTILRDPLGCSSSGSRYEDAGDFDGMKVWKCDELADGPFFHPVDLLYVPDIEARIEHFPDDISKCWIDGRRQLWGATPSALDNIRRQQVTYQGSLMRPARLERLRELYPTYEFRDLESDLTLIYHSPAKQAKRRSADPAYAPLWWDLPSQDSAPFQQSCMDAVRDFCAPTRR